jgi:hypothetical protein
MIFPAPRKRKRRGILGRLNFGMIKAEKKADPEGAGFGLNPKGMTYGLTGTNSDFGFNGISLMMINK